MDKTKMKIDFLLSPDTNSGTGDRSSGGRSNKAESALSLDFIAPRRSNDDKSMSSRHHRKTHSTAPHQSRSTQSSRVPHSTSSKVPCPKESGASSRSHFKSKKSKSPGSPSVHRPGSSSAEVKPHACRSCDKSFYKLEQLKRHDRLVHLNLRPFVCTTCDLSFGTKQNMQVHLTTKKHKHRLEALRANPHYSEHGSSSRQHR